MQQQPPATDLKHFDPNVEVLSAAHNTIPVIFTNNSRNIICTAADVIFEHSTSTGFLTSKFSLHQRTVHPIVWTARSCQEDVFLLLTKNGSLYWWNSNTRSVVKEAQLPLPKNVPSNESIDFITFFPYEDADSKEEKYFIVAKRTKQPALLLLHLDPSTDRLDYLADLATQRGQFNHKTVKLSFIEQYQLVLLTYESYFVTYSMKSHSKTIYSHKKRITSLANDSDALQVAFGDVQGAIFVFPYECVASGINLRKGQKLHWHSSAVSCLLFSGGNQLISGGKEAVLVTWNLSTGANNFIPRLSSCISTLSLSSDKRMLAVGLSDNTICIFSTASMSLIQSVHSLGLFDNLNQKSSSFEMIHRPGSDMVVLPGGPGKIQFYNIHTNSHSFFQDIVGHNQIISNVVDGIGSDSIVILVSFSSDSSCMVTVERRIVSGIKKDTMKCWLYSPDKLHYILHSIIDSPHIGGVTTLAFSNSSSGPLKMITGGNDGRIKLWSFVDNRWICHLYRSYKQLIPSTVKFSNDNSLLCVSFSHTITFWSIEGMNLLGTFTDTLPDSLTFKIQSILFIPASPLICFCTRNVLFLFNMLTLRIVWKKEFELTCGSLFHLDKDIFCLFTGNSVKTCISVFSSSSSLPIGLHESACSISNPIVVEKDIEKGIAKIIANIPQPNPRIVMLELPFDFNSPSPTSSNLESVQNEILKNKIQQVTDTELLLENSFRNLFGFYETCTTERKTNNLFARKEQNFNSIKSLELEKISTLALPPVNQLCEVFFNSLFINKS